MEDYYKYLVKGIQNNDEQAFEILFKEYYNNLFLYALKFFNDKELARDLVQNTFYSFWKNRDKLSEEKSIKGYLFTTLHNECINYINREKVKVKYNSYKINQIKELEVNYYSSSENSLSTLIAKELESEINKLIESLPNQCKLIFKMSRFEKLKNKEIAIKLQLSVRTVENQIYRALTVMYENLQEYL